MIVDHAALYAQVQAILSGVSLLGTANQVVVTPDGVGAVTLSLPQSIHTGAKPTFAGVILSAPARLKGYTVANLPAGTQGDVAFCTNLLTPTFLAAAVGGGIVVGPVFYDGTQWVSF